MLAVAALFLVVGITDGDTLTLLSPEKEQLKIRLSEIDAPESKQPFGARSKRSLSDICYKKNAQLEVHDIDRYGRTVAVVTCEGVNANREMVRRGMAWCYTKYLRGDWCPPAEADAKTAKRGLWSEPSPTPPWTWRKSGKKTSSAKASAARSSDVACGTKRTCGQMANCAEARAFMTQCGLNRLDGDHDGVPCESICR